MKKIVALMSLAFASLAVSAAPNLVVNGSFESNYMPAGNWSIYGALTGWQSFTNGIELRNAVAGNAQDGANFVELDTYSNSSMVQNIATTASTQYLLSFWYSPRPDTQGWAASTNDIQVTWNGNQVSFASGLGNGQDQWTHYTALVSGTGFDQLGFAALGQSDGYGGSLDNVTLTAAVPEPETYAMLLAGLGLMGAVARRRKQSI